MPKLIYKLPKYSLHKATGQARIKYAGKVRYMGRYDSPETHQRYDDFIETIPKPPEEVTTFAEPARPGGLLVGELALRYLAHAKAYYAREGVPTGEHVTIRSSLAPLTKRFADLPVTDLGPKKLKQVREDMIARGWSRKYCNKATSIIKRCFAWAAEEELIPAEVSNGLIPVKGLKKGRSAAHETEPVGPVDDKHVDADPPRRLRPGRPISCFSRD